MKKLTKLVTSSLFGLVVVSGCGDDPDGDKPSTGGTGAEHDGGSGGSPRGHEGGNDAGGSPGSGNDGGSLNAGGGGDGAGASNRGECELEQLADGGEVPASGTLESGHAYRLVGLRKVYERLTIEPCVKVFGDTGTKGTLVIMPGAELIAEGTADAPIVFTSSEPEGLRAPGDWGGVMLLGKGACNDATSDSKCEIEGLTDGTEYGNTAARAVDDDSSGSLKYVRIEYPGVDLDGNGNEINGLTLGGVGSGTTISHVMVSNTLDDCFEWFGGAVNADHLVAFNCGDDMFDADAGFSGKVQFAFGRQRTTITSDPSGFEMDNDEVDPDKTPVTAPSFANVTLCGTGSNVAGSGPQVGMVLRRGVDARIVNAVVTGFFTAALSVRESPNTEATLTSSLIFGNQAEFDVNHAGGAAWFTDQAGNGNEEPEGFGDCFGRTPAPFPAERIEGEVPTGHAEETASYVGAFADADDDWMGGAWVDWATE
jgi:hypothetical protein